MVLYPLNSLLSVCSSGGETPIKVIFTVPVKNTEAKRKIDELRGSLLRFSSPLVLSN
jgi:hypothetical protein